MWDLLKHKCNSVYIIAVVCLKWWARLWSNTPPTIITNPAGQRLCLQESLNLPRERRRTRDLILYHSSPIQIMSGTNLRPASVRRDMPQRLVCPASMVTVVRWASGGVRAPSLTRFVRLNGWDSVACEDAAQLLGEECKGSCVQPEILGIDKYVWYTYTWYVSILYIWGWGILYI